MPGLPLRIHNQTTGRGAARREKAAVRGGTTRRGLAPAVEPTIREGT